MIQRISNNLRIVYYHMIAESSPSYYPQNGSIDTQSFNRQIKYYNKKYNIISIDEAVYIIDNNKKFKNSLVITFDDGFSSVYKNATPILEKYKLPACFYLISDCVLKNKMMWRNILFLVQNNFEKDKINKICLDISLQYGLDAKDQKQDLLGWSMLKWPMDKRQIFIDIILDELSVDIDQYINHYRPYMKKKEIVELINSGYTIGSHSVSHPNFSMLNYSEALDEILESKKALESHLGCIVSHFSYPFGIRMDRLFENKIYSDHRHDIKSMVGTKNKFDKYKNPYKLERDKMEVGGFEWILRMYAIPTIRRLIK